MASVDEIWVFVLPVFKRLLVNLKQGLTMKDHVKCYSKIFNFLCSTHHHGEELHSNYTKLIISHVKNLVSKSKDLSDEELLIYFQHNWNEYKWSNKCIDSMMAYFNRVYIKNRTPTEVNVYGISLTADLIWRDHMFEPISKRLTRKLLEIIRNRRDGIRVEHGDELIRDSIECYIRVGINPDSPDQETYEIYLSHFQQQFLHETENYYISESNNYIEKNGIDAYLIKIDEIYAEELNYSLNHFPVCTTEELEKLLNTTLIKNHLKIIQDQFNRYLESDKQDFLKRMHHILIRIDSPECFLPLEKKFEEFIIKVGHGSIDILPVPTKPDIFVNTILDIYHKFEQLIADSFRIMVNTETLPDKRFLAANDKAFRLFMNDNSIYRKALEINSSALSPIPQLLSKYCDMVLKKGPNHIPDDHMMEKLQNDIVSLFKYLPDKDIFMVTYQKLLSRRLISNSSANSDFESSMIIKLRSDQGFEYCSKLQRMMQDIDLSEGLNISFKDYCQNQEIDIGFDASINVLANGIWPLSIPTTTFQPPKELEPVTNVFKSFYDKTHGGRKLIFMYHISKAQMVSPFIMKGRVKLQTSTFQMAVLLAFNTVDGDDLTYSQILDHTQLNDSTCKIALLGLLKVTVLLCDANDKHEDWTNDTVFTLNRGFKSKRMIVQCSVPIDISSLKSGVSGHKTTVEAPELRRERELKIQAAIVRIMKMRKTLGHNDLIAEVTPQIQKWFRPQISMIKTVIETLIENEYITRVTDEQGNFIKKYEYVA